jgi:hypothetical protein
MASSEIDPNRGANDVYWAAWHAGAWSDEHETDKGEQWENLRTWGAEFVQLADAFDTYRDPRSASLLPELVREAAQAVLSNEALPDWEGRHEGVFRLGRGD